MAEKDRIDYRHSSLNFEWGIVVGLAILLVMFELVPASELGRLSTRTADSEMEAIEADLAFDDTVEEQEEEVEEEQQELEQETEEMVEEIETDVTLSLDEETEGLEEVETIAQSEEGVEEGGGDEEMGPPRFMPVEVFPNCTYRPAPNYPEMAAQAGVEGSVALWVYVNSDGTVEDVQLYNSSGVNSLDEAAMAAAWNTRWTPAENNGIPVSVWTTLTYNFTLTD